MAAFAFYPEPVHALKTYIRKIRVNTGFPFTFYFLSGHLNKKFFQKNTYTFR